MAQRLNVPLSLCHIVTMRNHWNGTMVHDCPPKGGYLRCTTPFPGTPVPLCPLGHAREKTPGKKELLFARQKMNRKNQCEVAGKSLSSAGLTARTKKKSLSAWLRQVDLWAARCERDAKRKPRGRRDEQRNDTFNGARPNQRRAAG